MFYHQGSDTAHVVHALKYLGRREVGRTMGRLMACDVKPTGFFDGVDALVPVPLSRPRQRRRGYNQSEVLASGIAEVTGGQYFRAKDKSSLESIYQQIDQLEKTKLRVREYSRSHKENFMPFLLAALGCLLLEVLLRHFVLRTISN
jgi:predicted amidophosphoribosyltransferase